MTSSNRTARPAWRALFSEWDVLLAPVVVFLALLHSTQPFHQRTAIIDGRTIRFVKLVEEQIGGFQRPPGFDL